MVPITQVAKGIFKIGPLETGLRTPATSPHLIVGERAAIVEPGEGGQVPALLEGIAEIGVGLDRIDYIMPSHIHLHHCAGVNMLMNKIPHTRLVVHYRGVPHLVDPTRLNAGTYQVWGEGCPSINPVPEGRIWGVKGGEVIDLGGRELEIIDAQGHAPHLMAIFDRQTRALFPGDAAGVIRLNNERGRPDILPPLFELDRHIETLHRLRSFNPSVLFVYGYGGVSFSPDQTLQWAEDDVRTVERIVREGMEQHMTSREIGEKIEEYYEQVGLGTPQGEWGGERSAPIGMVNYVKRKHPDLDLPRGIDPATGRGVS